MKNKTKPTDSRRLYAFLLVIVMFFSTFVGYIPVAEAGGAATGSTYLLKPTGYKDGQVGGLDYVDAQIFQVGVARDPGFYNGGLMEDKQNNYTSFNHRFYDNENSLMFVPYDKWRSDYELGEYDPATRSIQVQNDVYNKSRVIRLQPKPATFDTRVKDKIQQLGYSFTGDKKYSELAGGKWKTVLGDAITYDQAVLLWSYIISKQSADMYRIHENLNEVVSQYATQYGYTTKPTLSDEQSEDVAAGYIGLLISTWRLVPDNYEAVFEQAIEDYLTQNLQGKGQQPTSIVIDSVMPIKFADKETRMYIPSIDFFQYYTSQSAKWDFHNTTEEMVGTSKGDTYKLLERIVNGDIADSSENKFRLSDAYNEYNIFSFLSDTVVRPFYRFNTYSPTGVKGVAGWEASDVGTNYIDSIYLGKAEVLGVGNPGDIIYGFTAVNFALPWLAPKDMVASINFTATPDDKLIPSSSEMIGEQVTLTFESPYDSVVYGSWEKLLLADENINKTIRVKITPTRTASPTAQVPAQYTSASGDFTTGVDMPKQDFLKFIKGDEVITMLDNTASEPIDPDTKQVYTYKPKIEITYNNGVEDKTIVINPAQDTASFIRPPNPPEYIGYTSEPDDFAEFKHESPDNEDYEAMAGVPSNKRLYVGVGGSEFIVDIELEYKENVDSVWRTYRSYYTGRPSEHKVADTHIFHNGQAHGYSNEKRDEYSYTWNYHGSKPAPKPPAPKTVCHTASSDGKTRCYKEDVQHIIQDSPPSHSQTETSHSDSSGVVKGYYLYSVPMHAIDGPECTYDLPGVEDNWKQRINYDYMRISRVEVYKIEEGRITKVDNVLGSGNSTVKATIKQGEPNIFYNIAQQNSGGNDTTAQSSMYGRLRYTLEEGQHDTVVWYEGVRSGTSAGMGANGVSVSPNAGGERAVQAGGHNNTWAKGILYNNTVQTTEENYHRNRGHVNTAPSALADAIDVATPEWQRFNMRRTSLNKATVISDMLILQTSSGDQAVMYFQRDSETVQSQQQFPDVNATKEEMWDNNPLSAANWDEDEVNVGSYNGQYEETGTSDSDNKKYWGYNYANKKFINNKGNSENTISTRFDSNGAGTNMSRKRPTRPSKLYIYQTKDIVPTTQNGAYVTGDADVFYERILSWKTPTPYEEYGGIPLRPNHYTPKVQSAYDNKSGLVYEAPYSRYHNKVNDIVIHTPVSVQDAMIISLPDYMDQRTEMPPGGAAALIDRANIPVGPKVTGNLFTPAIDKYVTTVTKVTNTEKTTTTKNTEVPSAGTGSKDFSYTGGVQTFTAPQTGTYTFEVWGAQGGNAGGGYVGGKGGYAKGTINLTAGQVVNVYVGQSGLNQSSATFNGGGAGSGSYGDSGGGATDIRVGGTALSNRVIVAGGGGGAGYHSGYGGHNGGGGGGTSGGNTSYNTGANQTSGYSLGVGQNATGHSGGGGGGYWGGRSATSHDGGSGGSGYVGGVNAIANDSNVNSGNGKAKISWDFPPEYSSTSTSTTKTLAPITSTSTSRISTGDPNGYKGWTWEQLFGENWQNYIIVQETNTKKTSTDTNTSSYKPRGSVIDIPGLKTKTFGGATWARILYQDISSNTNYFTSNNYLNVNKQGLFSALGQLEKFKTGGKYEFMLNYPDATGIFANKYNRWKQSNNPLDEKGVVNENNATGFEAIHMDMPGYAGKGLEFNGSSAIFDGIVGHGNWWLAVGIMNTSYAPTNTPEKPYTMPGPSDGTNSQGVSQVELWVRIDGLLVNSTPPSTSGVVPNPVTFNYTGGVQNYTVPETGTYQLEAWGAGGGGADPGTGPSGGYVKASVSLTKGQILYVYVGQGGVYNGGNWNTVGSWNGGGYGEEFGGDGGGATDFRLSGTSLNDRIVVAGGGGGASDNTYNTSTSRGGGWSGENGTNTGGGTASSGGSGYSSSGDGTLGQGGNVYSGCSNSGGGGGGGYYGGGAGCGDNSSGGGGSSYVTPSALSKSTTVGGGSAGGTTNGNAQHGKALITPLNTSQPEAQITYDVTTYVTSTSEVTVTEEATIVMVDEAKVKNDLALFPDRMPDGSFNPVKYGYGVTEPTPPSPVTTPVETTDGGLVKLATFINIDYPFKLYFPNQGNFAQQPTLDGIKEITTIRGRGYVNNMDTTEWTESKRVQFQFNVIYDGTLYPSGAWIDLPVAQEYFDFYAVLANNEAMASEVKYEAIPINGRPIGDPENENYEEVTNKDRKDNYYSLHGAFKKSYLDVVGRIGNFAVTDTEDFRFSNLFKMPVCSTNCTNEEWVVDGLVKKVFPNIQNKYYGDLYDIRREPVNSTGDMLNTWGTQEWMESATLLQLPVNPKDNEVPALKEQFLKPGYDLFSEITTIGDYTEGVIRALPYFYKLDVQTGEVTPLDVYQKSGEEYEPVNLYRAADSGEVPSEIKEYGLIIDWVNEYERRNYTMDESTITDTVAEAYGEYVMGVTVTPGGNMVEGVTDIKKISIPEGNFVSVGNSQRIVADKYARTFIGTSKTNNQDKNPNDVLAEDFYGHQAQRWHLKFGLPASAVFVEAGKEVTKENIEDIQKGTGVVLMSADIISIGDPYTLRWEQPGVSSVTVQKEGITKTFDLSSSGIPPVIALYDLETTAVIDIDVQGSH